MTNKDIEPGVLTPAQVAARYGKTRRTVYRWIKSGKIESYKIGGNVFIPVAKLPK